MTFRAFQTSLILSAVLVAGALSAADYSIQLHRSRRIGEKARMTVRLTERQERRLIVEGQVTRQRKESYGVEFAAVGQVDAVDAKGHVTRSTFTVEKCLRTSDTGSTNVVPRGTIITASSREGTTLFEYADGQPVPDGTSQLLGSLVSTYTGGADEDEMFGTRDRKKIGDSWPINAEAVRRDFEQKQPELSLDSVRGSTRLKRVARFNGMDCLEIEVALQWRPVPKEPPIGMTLESSEVAGTFAGRFPVDETRQPLYGVQEFTMKTSLTGKLGPVQPEGRAEINNYRRIERHFTEVAGTEEQ